MKILVAKFVLEANENIPMYCGFENIDIQWGEACIDRMQVRSVFNREDIELIPAICADAGSSGVMKQELFEYIENHILECLKSNIREIDGIFLHLHGASQVLNMGSGDHHILQSIRHIVGPYMPIVVVADPHGNLCKDYVENATVIRSYRESPHTDIQETIDFMGTTLIDLIENRRNIKPIYRKLALILGGEQSVSADEPVKSINQFMDSLEKDERILSVSWHVGYIRHDTHVAGCGIVVVPSDESAHSYASKVADDLAQYVWERRHQFHYTGLTAEPDEALRIALECEKNPVFLTDSGDNVTSGAMGMNTFILKQVLELDCKNKKTFLFAAIQDKQTYTQLLDIEIGQKVAINLGVNYDDLSAPVSLDVTVKFKGRQKGTQLFGETTGNFGGCITVSVEDKPVDIIVTDTNHPFVEHEQFQAAGLSWKDYDVVVVKIGYSFPELIANGALCIMSLTKGPTLQNTAILPFKRIMRPMFPIDEI